LICNSEIVSYAAHHVIIYFLLIQKAKGAPEGAPVILYSLKGKLGSLEIDDIEGRHILTAMSIQVAN